MIDLGEIGKLLIKIGGILAMVLGVVDVLKYAAYLILIYLAKGFLDTIISNLSPSLPWISIVTSLLTSSGSLVSAALLVLSVVFTYLGFRIFKAADEVPMPTKARDRWIIVLSVLFALSLLLSSPFLAISFLLPIIGLIIVPTQPPGVAPAPPAQSVK